MMSSWGQVLHEHFPAERSVPGDIFRPRLAAVCLPDVFYHPGRSAQENIVNLGNLQRLILHVLW
jgi:hypothetical protein